MIVVGTGLEESIIAAAVARNGHNVLHIDTKDYYGEDWASFNFRALQEWITSHSNESKNQKTDSEEAKTSEKKEELSTSEKAIIAEQQKKSEEDSTSTKDNAEKDDPETEEADSSSVKKRGRKPKAKE